MARQAQATKVAASIKQEAGSSAIADLESRATTASIRTARPAGVTTGSSTNFSGQYLYDRFVTGDKEEVTKMDIVRQMVKQLDTASFKKCIADFVGVSKGFVNNAVKADKDAGTYDKENPSAAVVNAMARAKTAANHQTVMRIAYGAIKFAGEALAELGYKEDATGYQVMRVIGNRALEQTGIKWDGSKLESREVVVGRNEQKAEAKIVAEVMAANPRQPDEERAAYFARIDEAVTEAQSAKREADHKEAIAKIVAKFKADAGPLLEEAIDALMNGGDDNNVLH